MKYPVSHPSTKSLGRLLLGLTLTTILAGCAVPARISYDTELAKLCAQPHRLTVFATTQLKPRELNKQGGPLFSLENGRPLLANRFWRDRVSEELRSKPEFNLDLTKMTTTITDKTSGKILGVNVTYCRGGGDSIAFNNTSECCPAAADGDLYDAVFKKDTN